MAMVLRSIYLDPTLDAELAGRAEVEGMTKAELMRRFLIEGLGRPAARFSGYATEATLPRVQHHLSHAAEPRAAYAAESTAAFDAKLALEPRESYDAAASSAAAAHGGEPEVDLRSGREDIATSAPRKDLGVRAPAAPSARVASGVFPVVQRSTAGAERRRRAASPVRSRSPSRSPR